MADFLYEIIISQWQSSVSQYCMYHNIPSMELRNLRKDDVYDYDLYVIYRQAKEAVETYRRTPASAMYAQQMVAAIKKWYIATADSKMQKLSLRIIPNDIFARLYGRIR